MKLFYYKDGVGNFGDDLNPWVFYQYAPDVFDGLGDYLVGIGTLINSRAPVEGRKHVFGSGVGYHHPAVVNHDWNFLFVRGPLSADNLKLPPEKAVTDPAILVADMVRRCKKRDLITFMPHQVSAVNGDWPDICRQLGITYLDPAGDIHENIHLINRSRLVLADAMHAAIVADALRVPWIPLKAYGHILDFKWQDWCQSLGMAYTPVTLPEYWTLEEGHDPVTRLKSGVKRGLMGVGFSGRGWTPPPPVSNRAQVETQLLLQLQRLIADGVQHLSEDAWHQRQLDRVLSHMHTLVRMGP